MGIFKLIKIAEIQEEPKERGFNISTIARICRKENGKKNCMQLVLVCPVYEGISQQRNFKYHEKGCKITNKDVEKFQSA